MAQVRWPAIQASEASTGDSAAHMEPAIPAWMGLLAQLRQELEQLQARNDDLAAQSVAKEGHNEHGVAEKGACTMAESGSADNGRAEMLTSEETNNWGDEMRTSEIIQSDREFRTEFKRLCEEGRISVSAEELYDMRVKQVPQSLASKVTLSLHPDNHEHAIATYKEALRLLNTEIQETAEASIDLDAVDEMQLDTYIALFRSKDWDPAGKLSKEHKSSLHHICQAAMNHAMMRDISEITDVDMELLWARRMLSCAEKCIHAIDCFSSTLIMLNILTLTLSLDVHGDWPGWQRIEFAFNGCFILEIFARVGLVGVRKHFCGHERGWNIFDLLVVGLGLLDALLSATGAISEKGPQVNVIRILRLLRIAKMARVLRLKIFKELRVIVSGLFGGLMTIFWGIVFLFFFVLTLGVSTKQFLSVGPQEPYCEDLPWGCGDSQLHLQTYRRELFGSVPRCMFTIFRCFVSDGCSSIDGTPLMPFLWDQYGVLICIFYVLNFLFLTFGLFNLIMATIVESTMEAASRDDAKRWYLSKQEHLKVALDVKDLVRALCAEEEEEDPSSLEASSIISTIKTRLFGSPWWAKDHTAVQVMLKSRISTKEFLENLQSKRVRNLLDKLGITTTDPSSYIDVFDVNEDGSLSIPELVRGLLKLRGRVDKADVIAGLMVTRDVQKSLKSIEAMLVRFGSSEADGVMGARQSVMVPGRRRTSKTLGRSRPSLQLQL